MAGLSALLITVVVTCDHVIEMDKHCVRFTLLVCLSYITWGLGSYGDRFKCGTRHYGIAEERNKIAFPLEDMGHTV